MTELPDAWAAPAKPKGPKAAPVDDAPAIELKSSVLARIRYHAADRALVAEFRNGSVYRYHGVSAEDFDALAKAPSPGARFNTDIVPYHEAERVD